MAFTKNASQQIAKHLIVAFALGAIFIIVLALSGLYIADTKPWKIKDPKNSKFDVSKFDPNDYKNGEELAKVLAQLVSPGVSTKDEVNNIWCHASACGTQKEYKEIIDEITKRCLSSASPQQPDRSLYYYSKAGKSHLFGMWDLWVVYGNDNKIINMCIRRIPVFPAN